MNPGSVEHAVRELRAGRPVIFPTDTVYGIAADPKNPAAVAALFDIKGRDLGVPLPLLVPSAEAAAACARRWNETAAALARAFWPGPLTIVVEKADWVPADVVSGGRTVGVRRPDHPAAQAVLDAWGGALACTSANRSGRPPAVRENELDPVFQSAGVAVIGGGVCPETAASTVILAADNGTWEVLREGPISSQELSQAIDS